MICVLTRLQLVIISTRLCLARGSTVCLSLLSWRTSCGWLVFHSSCSWDKAFSFQLAFIISCRRYKVIIGCIHNVIFYINYFIFYHVFHTIHTMKFSLPIHGLLRIISNIVKRILDLPHTPDLTLPHHLVQHFGVEDTATVAEYSSYRHLAWSIVLVSNSTALSVQHLPSLLQDVLGAVPTHWYHALPTLGGTSQVVLAGGGRHYTRPSSACNCPLISQPMSKQCLPPRGRGNESEPSACYNVLTE